MHQKMYAFYDFSPSQMYSGRLPPPPSEDTIRTLLSENNSRCPLNDILYGEENEGNLRTLRRLAFSALKRPNRSLSGCGFGMFGKSGQGKTFVVQKFAETIGIPFVFVQSSSLTDNYSLLQMIIRCHDTHQFNGDELYNESSITVSMKKKFPKIERLEDSKYDYTIPPCIVFFDEAHQIPKKMMQGSLLNAMEKNDGKMQARNGDEIYLIDCREICWVAATTERGVLFDAFENRLSNSIEWVNAAPQQVSRIVSQKIKASVSKGELKLLMPEDICLKVANYRKTPREAISFATQVVLLRDMIPSYSWDEAMEIVAKDMGIDQWGFSNKQIDILTALGQRPMAEGRLTVIAKCRIEQIQKYELPMLMSHTDNGPFVVALSGRGMAITMAGLEELNKRGIPHNGKRITAEHFEEKKRR